MLKNTLLTLILLLPLSANADPITLFGGESEFSLALGADVHKDMGKKYGELRYREILSENGLFGWGLGDDFGFSLYAGEMNTYGVDIYLTFGKLMLAWGAELADRTNEVVDSNGGYELLIEYAFTEHWALGIKHRSNCRQICSKVPGLSFLPKGDDDKTNGGYNFLVLRYTF